MSDVLLGPGHPGGGVCKLIDPATPRRFEDWCRSGAIEVLRCQRIDADPDIQFQGIEYRTGDMEVRYCVDPGDRVAIAVRLQGTAEYSVFGNPPVGGQMSMIQVLAPPRTGSVPTIIVEPPHATTRIMALRLSRSLFESLCLDIFGRSISAEDGRLWIRSPLTASVREAAEHVMRSTLTGSAHDIFLRGKALELAVRCVETLPVRQLGGSPAPTLRAADIEKLKRVCDAVDRNLANPGSLASLARDAGLNVKKLKYGFKAVFGRTVFDYVREQRLARAEILLREGDGNIDQIALKLGITSASYFARLFRQRHGVSPRQFRRLRKR